MQMQTRFYAIIASYHNMIDWLLQVYIGRKGITLIGGFIVIARVVVVDNLRIGRAIESRYCGVIFFLE